MTARPSHLLAVEVGGLARLRATMGDAFGDRAVAELESRLDRTLADVLALAQDVHPLPSPQAGRWCRGFSCAGPDAAENVETMRQAAARLVHDLTTEIFGAATGALARVRCVVLDHPGDDLDAAVRDGLARRGSLECEDGRRLRALIAEDGLRTLLQPIVRFHDAAPLAFEALTRGPAGHVWERADSLFGAAAELGLAVELEKACALAALTWVDHLPPGHSLFINTSVPLLRDDGLRAALAHPRVVVELTEHLPFDDAQAVLPLLDQLRRGGARIALDDTGCGFADLDAARVLRPDIVKLCITIIRGAGRDASILPELAATVAQFHALGAQVLAEGVETETEAAALRPMGIALAQGWLFGKPAAAAEVLGTHRGMGR